MTESRTQLLCAAVALGLIAGCQATRPVPATAPAEPAAPVAVSSPLTYEPARQGLPSGKIFKSQISFGDINGDGNPDIGFVTRLADGPFIFAGDGKGHWTDASNGLPRETFCGGGVEFADINNDGKTDVAVADHCKGVYVFLGDGAGNWKAASSGLPTIGCEDVAIGDFDKDGCADLVVIAASEEGIRTFRGDCKGTWRERTEGLPQNEWGNALAVGDVDGDGNLDIAAAYSAGPRVWLGNGKGGFREGSEGLPAPDVHGLYMFGIALGDVNGDGKLDLAASSAVPGIEVFLWDNGKWKVSSTGLMPMNALGVAFGDLNNDGKTDLVVAGKTNLEEIGGVYGVFPFLGDGQGNWKLVETTTLPLTGRERTWGVGLADVDRDGVLDIGVAFGDVLSPTYRTGGKKDAAKKAGDQKADTKFDPKAKLDPKSQGPERGRFGSIEVWRGRISR
ncbi:MAG: VCBS repeat-containing protein [Deltaproteobacteria bacterium]|nr:VCBS repeat-containing protein [Deltaproteobacteria bacterium]